MSETKYIPNGIVFEFVDLFDAKNTVNVILNHSDFQNGFIIDYTGAERRALSPRFWASEGHCSGIDTQHVVTYSKSEKFPKLWAICTHPHGRSCGSVRYLYAHTELECQDYVRRYVNRRFKRLNKFV